MAVPRFEYNAGAEGCDAANRKHTQYRSGAVGWSDTLILTTAPKTLMKR